MDKQYSSDEITGEPRGRTVEKAKGRIHANLKLDNWLNVEGGRGNRVWDSFPKFSSVNSNRTINNIAGLT